MSAVCVINAAIRSEPASDEEAERAQMRSMSVALIRCVLPCCNQKCLHHYSELIKSREFKTGKVEIKVIHDGELIPSPSEGKDD